MPRITSAQQLFDSLPAAFLPEQAQGVNAVIQFELTGPDGGDWQAQVANGQLTLGPGRAANPTVTLTASAADYLAIVNGDLSAMGAFMSGKVKIKGDVGLVMKMQKMFRTG